MQRKCGKHLSVPFHVSNGIGQGEVLSPYFLLYIQTGAHLGFCLAVMADPLHRRYSALKPVKYQMLSLMRMFWNRQQPTFPF